MMSSWSAATLLPEMADASTCIEMLIQPAYQLNFLGIPLYLHEQSKPGYHLSLSECGRMLNWNEMKAWNAPLGVGGAGCMEMAYL